MKNQWLLCVSLFLLAAPLGAQDPEESLLRAYAIREITQPIVERLWVPESGESKQREHLESAGMQIARMARKLMPAATMKPGQPETSVRSLGGEVLLIQASTSQHKWCAKFLDTWRTHPLAMIQVHARILTATAETFVALRLPNKPTVLDTPHGAAESIRRLVGEQGVDLLSAPKIATQNANPASVAVLNQVAYIKDFEVHLNVEPEGGTIVDPIVDVIQEGITWKMLPVLLDEKTIAIDSEFTLSKLTRPIPTFKTEHGEIGLPEVTKLTVETTLKIENGATVMFPTTVHEGKRMLLLITATLIDVEELEKELGDKKKEKKEL